VLQSASIIDNKLYAVINNSNSIYKINPNDGTIENRVSSFNSPRYVLPINSSQALVTDLYHDKIVKINLDDCKIVTTTTTNTWTEQMLQSGNDVFIACPESDYLLYCNTNSTHNIDSIQVGYGSLSMVLDKNNLLWVLCWGDESKAKLPSLFQVNPLTKSIVRSMYFNTYSRPSRLCIDAAKEHLYFINNAIYKMNINDNILPLQAFIPSNGANFYGLATYKNNIVTMDAKDYNSLGEMLIFDANATLKVKVKVGIIPSDICIY
jgi:hypothetical protein